jgi:hypothetical protein
MSPVQVEVITPLPEGWGICLSCEALIACAGMEQPPSERGMDEYPPEWQDEFRRFSDLIFELSARYGDTILIRIFDPRSLQGLWKSIRHGVRHYPTFLVAGQAKIAGLDVARIKSILQSAGAVEQFTAPALE